MGAERFPQRIVRFLHQGSLSEPAGDRPLAFIHINKTAGTTFTEYLRGHFAQRDSVAPPYFGDFAQIGVNDSALRLYWGHFTLAQFGRHRPESLFITFLRDPIDRIVSQYRSFHNPANVGDGWEKVLPLDARAALLFAQRATFEEFVLSEHPFIVGHLQDLQARFLSSHVERQHPRFLSSAIDNLENRVLFFGLTEQFSRSIRLFQYQLGSQKQYISEQPRRNVSQQYAVDMTDAARERVEQLVEQDRRLYEHAVSIFERRCNVLRQLDGTRLARPAA